MQDTPRRVARRGWRSRPSRRRRRSSGSARPASSCATDFRNMSSTAKPAIAATIQRLPRRLGVMVPRCVAQAACVAPPSRRFVRSARQFSNPAWRMAASIRAFVPSVSPTSGRRTSSEQRPSRDRPYFAPARPGSRRSPRAAASGGPDSPAPWHSRPPASPPGTRRKACGATFAVTLMQPTPPCALKPSAVASSPDSWMKSAPAGGALLADTLDLAGGVLDPDDARQLRQLRPSCRASCRRPTGRGCCR